MKIEDIQALIKFVARSGVSEVELEMNDVKLVIKTPAPKPKGKAAAEQTVIQAVPMANVPHVPAAMPAAPVAPVAPVAAAPAPAPAPAPAAAPAPEAAAEDNSKYIEVKSPMIGTFYRSPSPDKPVFCNVGDTINSGDVVCIIEAMKLFNEIESEVSGKIVKVLVDDATPVEYDQPLFLVDPS
ncbi:acetyl-CoA carboxylase biotin carboxyl carrier protein [bacterium SCSIO 12741]|nr:acetyl-CoA carboxylase biotin carboxyl carrier protein [bacterium SCSIO 12741]